MKQPDLYNFEAIKGRHKPDQSSQRIIRLRIVFSMQNLTRLVTSFLWFQNSMDQAVS